MTGPRCTTAAPSRSLRTRWVRGARSLHPRPRSRAPPHDRRRHRLSLHGYSHRCIPIEAQKADYPLALMCRLWGVPRGRAMFELLRLGRAAGETAPRAPAGPLQQRSGCVRGLKADLGLVVAHRMPDAPAAELGVIITKFS